LPPKEISDLVVKTADIASYDYGMADANLFSFDDTPRQEVIKAEKSDFKVFDFIFEKVDQSVRKVDYFTVENTDGFGDISDDFISALERYPGFFQQLRKLTLTRLENSQVQR
jgi:hypothetical protein